MYTGNIPVKGMKMRAKRDCFCEGYLHELSRGCTWKKEKKLMAGEEVSFVRMWSNLFGTYYEVEKQGDQYDIKPEDLEEVK